jgi:pimeloyl-ACP methyl ester carboxylesterase
MLATIETPAAEAGTERRVVRTNGVELRVETFGDRRDPAVLLIMGATAPMIRWPETLCRRIAGSGRYVIRYDNRDTGQSTAFAPGDPGYDVRDLARDAVGILDALGIEKAHAAGLSMGGMIVQHLAIFHASRLHSATIVASSPAPFPQSGIRLEEGKATLSPPWPVTMRLIEFLRTVDWRDEQAAIDAWLREDLDMLGSGDVRDERTARAIVTEVVRGARNVASHRLNHPIAVATTPPWRERLADIRTPVLVFHGSDDAILPIDHGRAMAREIPGARLIEVEGMGHIVSQSSRYWADFAEALIAHMARTGS